MNLSLTLIFFLMYIYGTSQVDKVMGERIFHSIREAQSVNPDSVTHLQLGNNDLRKFPVEIFQFKNLNFLSFVDSNLGEIYESTPWLLSDHEKSEAIEKFRKWGHGRRVYPEGVSGFPTYHKNKIAWHAFPRHGRVGVLE